MMNNNMPNMPHENADHMYPEVYHKFMPVAHGVIKDMEKQYGEIYLHEDMLNDMVDEAMRRSGIEKMDNNMNNSNMPQQPMPLHYDVNGKDDPDDDPAIPTVSQFGRHHGGGRPRRQTIGHRRYDPWRYYDPGFSSDLFRILFLQELLGRPRYGWRF